MEHKIVAFNAETGSATVKFWTEAYPSGLLLNVDIPVENGAYISGEALNSLIQSFAPVGQIARLVALRDNPPSAAGIVVDPDPLPPPPSDELPPDPILDATLLDAIKFAETSIDRAASSARARFISSGVGQDAVYVVKGQQAEAFAAAGFNGDPPAYIAAEAAATGVTPMVAAQTILGLRDAWNNLIGPAIESQRIGGKKLVREATTVEEVDARMRAATLALQEIRP